MDYRNLISSATGTLIAELITLPISSIKTNYQTNLHHKSISHTIKHILNNYGIKGFYNSIHSSLISQMVSTGTKFTFYNYIKTKRNTQQHDLKNNIVNGALGGIMSSVIVHPIDVWKVHQQNNIPFIPELRKIGPSFIYRGYSKTLSKNICLTSLIFPFYDFYKSTFNSLFIATILASITVTFVLHPIDYLKIRHITGQTLYLKSSGVYENMKYYYRGLSVNLLRIIPHFMITMYLTEHIKQRMSE